MFPYPSGVGLHVGHPLGFIGTDVFGRYKRMTGHNVLHTMGFDAFGLPAEQYAVETGTHPAITTDRNVATYRRQLRRLGLAHDPRRSVSTTDPEYYRWTQWIFNRIFNAWYDTDAAARPTDRRVDRRVRQPAARPTPDGRPWADLTAGERADDRRRPSPGLRQRGAGQLVPRARHRRRQRGGHRRRPQRPRQLPRVQAQHAPVDDAHHGLRRPPHRRPRPARLDRLDQGDAAQLDRPQPRRTGALRFPGRTDHRVHHPARHAVRRVVPRALPRAPARRRLDHRRATSTRSPSYRTATAAKKEFERQDESREKTGVFTRLDGDQPDQRRGAPDLDRRLRADGLRHRRDHGGAVRRPARLRVRQQVRPADPRDPAAARRLVRRAGHRPDARHAWRGPSPTSATRRTSPRPTTRST